MSAYNDYYNNLLQQQRQFQKTPDQILQEQKIQAYQSYIATPEGSAAVAELNTKFNSWFDLTYGVKKPEQINEVKEMKDMILALSNKIEALSTSGINNQNNNQNKK